MKKFLCNFSYIKTFTIFIIFFLLYVLASNKPVHASSFITTKGTNFYLNGKKFQSIGVNRYDLMNLSGNPFVCGSTFSNSDLSTWFSGLHQMGVTSVRFWLFQSFTQNGTNLSRFNYILSLARQYHIKVIPVFENQLSDCTQLGYKNPAWYQTGYLAPYGTYSLSLKDYISKIVPVYKNNPNIFMWQIMNEAESSDATALYNFAKDVSSYIKSLDSNHLVSLGALTAGPFNTELYKNIYSLSTIDVLDYHDYGEETNPLPNNLYDRWKYAQTLKKPLIIGEAGIDLNKFSPQQRSIDLSNKMNAYFQNHGTAYLVWSYRDVSAKEQSYDFTFTDPLVPVIQQYSAALQSDQPFSSQITPIPIQVRLGGLNLNGYCKTLNINGATLTNNTWYCGNNTTAIDMNAVCTWQYPNQHAIAKEDYAGNPYSWTCYKVTTSPLF